MIIYVVMLWEVAHGEPLPIGAYVTEELALEAIEIGRANEEDIYKIYKLEVQQPRLETKETLLT